MAVSYKDLPSLTKNAESVIRREVKTKPGHYSPSSIVQAMENGEFGGVGAVVTYLHADGYPGSDAPGAIALWDLIDRGIITLSNEWKLYPS